MKWISYNPDRVLLQFHQTIFQICWAHFQHHFAHFHHTKMTPSVRKHHLTFLGYHLALALPYHFMQFLKVVQLKNYELHNYMTPHVSTCFFNYHEIMEIYIFTISTRTSQLAIFVHIIFRCLNKRLNTILVLLG